MIVLGLSGAFGLPGEVFIPDLPDWFFHDAAAVLLRDGEIVAAVEEERVTRVKHTNTLAVGAARRCLELAHLAPESIDAIAYFFREDYANNELGLQYAEKPSVPLRWARELLVERMSAALGRHIASDVIHFVPHHLAHAVSAYYHSGLNEALVAVLDGNGEEESVSLFAVHGTEFNRLWTEPPDRSLGHLYCLAIELLGYRRFDEYKVMGLAPYGDPKVYRSMFDELVSLQADGRYALNTAEVRSHFLRKGLQPRRHGAPFEQVHADLAAGLQDCLERVALHLLAHWSRRTTLAYLCVAGGVGLNCSMNGRIARSGLFRQMFVHPWPHDAGAAAGAAMIVEGQGREPRGPKRAPLRHVAWGHEIDDSDVKMLVERWDIAVETLVSGPSVIRATAERLADGAIVGWARGRMEFGPRALGQRSILADPRPLANRERINRIVKKREAYRPFAPMVHASFAKDWFELPDCVCNLDAMGFAVQVRPEHRELLAAVTHVDGSARLQMVDPTAQPDIAELLVAFAERTNLPVLLNTSFNVDAEPIVATAGEALLCFLMTDLDFLVLGNRLLVRRSLSDSFWLDLVPVPRPDTRMIERTEWTMAHNHRVSLTLSSMSSRTVSLPPESTEWLQRVDGRRSFRECGLDPETPAARAVATHLIRDILGSRLLRIVALDACG